jgi:RNA polymerase sigma-70 factor (ECF subfamily)
VAPSSAEVAAAAACVDAFDAEYDYVCRVLRRFHVRDADVEDVAQEVFLVVWRRWRDYDPRRPLRPWLAGVAYRVAYNHQTRSSSAREIPAPWLDDTRDPDADPERELIQADMRGILLRALKGIADKPRSVLILHDVDEVEMRDIAALLSIPLYTAYSRLRVGRRQLVAALRRIQASGRRGDEFDLPAKLDVLLERERQPPPLPAARRRNAIGRLRALVPLLPALPQSRSTHPTRPRSTPVLATVAWTTAVIGVGLAVAMAIFTAGSAPRVKVGASGAALDDTAPSPAPPVLVPSVPPGPVPLVDGNGGLSTRFGAAADPLTRNEGLIGYWRFDDGAGSGYARDLSGSGNDCTLHRLDRNGAWIDGRHGGALQFDGAGWLECPQLTALDRDSHEMTIALWVKRSRAARRVRGLVTRQLGHETKDAFHLGFRDDQLLWQSSLWRVTVAALPGRPLDGWHHIASTRTASRRAALYVDGVLVTSKKTGPEIAADLEAGSLIIGGGVNGPNPDAVRERFEGAVDEVLLFKRALGAAEIAALAGGAQPPVSQ